MRLRALLVVCFLLLAQLGGVPPLGGFGNNYSIAQDQPKPALQPVDLGTITEKHVMIPMRDGTKLSAYLYSLARSGNDL